MKWSMALLTVLLLVLPLLLSCSDDKGTAPEKPDPLLGTWFYVDRLTPNNYVLSYIVIEEDAEHLLYESGHGWRDRYTRSCSIRNDTLFYDGGTFFACNREGDTLRTDMGRFVRTDTPATADDWIKAVTPRDSTESKRGDMTWNGENLLLADGSIYVYSTSPLAIIDTTYFGTSLRGLAWDGSAFWRKPWSGGIDRYDPEADSILANGPDIYASSLAWGNGKLWIYNSFDEFFLSYNPESGLLGDSLEVDGDRAYGIEFLNGHVYYIVDGVLYQCATAPHRILQAWQFRDNWIPGNTLRTKMVYMATDGETVWVNTQKTDGTMDAMIYRVEL